MWARAKEEQLNPNELKNKMLLAKGNDGRTAFQLAANSGELKNLSMTWSRKKDVQYEPFNLLLL